MVRLDFTSSDKIEGNSNLMMNKPRLFPLCCWCCYCYFHFFVSLMYGGFAVNLMCTSGKSTEDWWFCILLFRPLHWYSLESLEGISTGIFIQILDETIPKSTFFSLPVSCLLSELDIFFNTVIYLSWNSQPVGYNKPIKPFYCLPFCHSGLNLFVILSQARKEKTYKEV